MFKFSDRFPYGSKWEIILSRLRVMQPVRCFFWLPNHMIFCLCFKRYIEHE